MPLVVYSLLRLALFGVALLALWAVGMRSWLLVVVAALVAWALSYVLLHGPRDAAALWLAQRAERRRTGPRFGPGVEGDAAAEDAEAERPAAEHADAEHADAEHADAELRAAERGDAEHRAAEHTDLERPDEDGPDGPQSARPSPSSTP